MAGQGPAAHPAAVAVLVDADHLEELGNGFGRIQGLKNPDGSRRELDAVALVKVHGRAVTKGIEPIDAGLAGHDQGAGAMGRRTDGGEGGEGEQTGQEAALLAERRRWQGLRQWRRFPASLGDGEFRPIAAAGAQPSGLKGVGSGAPSALKQRMERRDLL
jgi:hypothetical protein